jgi:hypothetical protein
MAWRRYFILLCVKTIPWYSYLIPNVKHYVNVGWNVVSKSESSWLPCYMVSLPGTSHPETLTYIISNTSHYKGLETWRWVPYEGVNILLSKTRKETSYSDQTQDLLTTVPTTLNTLLSPLLELTRTPTPPPPPQKKKKKKTKKKEKSCDH